MKTSNKIIIITLLIIILPTVVTLVRVVKASCSTIEVIDNIDMSSIRVVDATRTKLFLARDDSAFAENGLVSISSNVESCEPVKVCGDTLILGPEVVRVSIPKAEKLLLADTVIVNPFFKKSNSKGYAVYVTADVK